jgi:predicted RecB family endonuclease
VRLLVCGDRNWTDRNAIYYCLKALMLLYKPVVVIEGECRGADLMARSVAEQLGLEVVPFPADWKKLGRAAGPVRNRQMLEIGKPDLVLAFHADLEHSRGTRNMIEQARKKRIQFRVITGGPP